MAPLSASLTAAQLQKLQAMTTPQSSTTRTQLLALLRDAEQAAQWGNPVRARQHVLKAIRLVEELIKL